MKTEYTENFVAICPDNRRDVGNHLAGAIGTSGEGDLQTFRQPQYTDGTTDYYLLWTVCKPKLVADMQAGTLDGDPPHYVDPVKVAQAMDSLVLLPGLYDEAGEPLALNPDKITVVLRSSVREAAAAFGLERIEEDPE